MRLGTASIKLRQDAPYRTAAGAPGLLVDRAGLSAVALRQSDGGGQRVRVNRGLLRRASVQPPATL